MDKVCRSKKGQEVNGALRLLGRNTGQGALYRKDFSGTSIFPILRCRAARTWFNEWTLEGMFDGPLCLKKKAGTAGTAAATAGQSEISRTRET